MKTRGLIQLNLLVNFDTEAEVEELASQACHKMRLAMVETLEEIDPRITIDQLNRVVWLLDPTVHFFPGFFGEDPEPLAEESSA